MKLNIKLRKHALEEKNIWSIIYLLSVGILKDKKDRKDVII